MSVSFKKNSPVLLPDSRASSKVSPKSTSLKPVISPTNQNTSAVSSKIESSNNGSHSKKPSKIHKSSDIYKGRVDETLFPILEHWGEEIDKFKEIFKEKVSLLIIDEEDHENFVRDDVRSAIMLANLVEDFDKEESRYLNLVTHPQKNKYEEA